MHRTWTGDAPGRDAAVVVGVKAALAAAVLSAILPWSARLGVATVPELPTAALALLALGSLAPPRGGEDERALLRRRPWGGAALLAACLSRYEVWPLAAGFAALSL